mmetsp:Transcript_131592/g.185622  ORF Transcript_131592/g.185622 Transcript_131592/m.185622 type:complete len:88 (+) Transcript_131592:62-325(+)
MYYLRCQSLLILIGGKWFVPAKAAKDEAAHSRAESLAYNGAASEVEKPRRETKTVKPAMAATLVTPAKKDASKSRCGCPSSILRLRS